MAENRVPWAFWPPGSKCSRTRTRGIWILDNDDVDNTSPSPAKFESESEESSDSDDSRESHAEEISDVQEDMDSASDGAKISTTMTISFGVLAVDYVDGEYGDEDDTQTL